MDETPGRAEPVDPITACADCKASLPVERAWVMPTTTVALILCDNCAVRRGISCSGCRTTLQPIDKQCSRCKLRCCRDCSVHWTCFLPSEPLDGNKTSGETLYYCRQCTSAAVRVNYRSRNCPTIFSCIFGNQ